MTTKQEERKALEQIRKIVDSLDAGSYISYAFEGCFELAEENIANDWCISMKDRVRDAERRAEELAGRIEDKDQRIKEVKAERELEQRSAERARERAEKAEEQIREQYSKCNELADQLETAKARIAAQEYDIIKLKARLFDLMEK